MYFSERSIALARAESLFGHARDAAGEKATPEKLIYKALELPRSKLKRMIFQAGLSLPATALIAISLLLGAGAAAIFSKILSAYFMPVFFLCGASLPYFWLDRKVRDRAAEFAADYPTVLLATASSLKVGLTPNLALERSTKLLPEQSLVRKEVERLKQALHRGVPKDKAVAEFGISIAQPELELFRAAFLLALENGGRFSPTLERLAEVSKDRQSLIRTARVSTSNMRMTANILLVLTPLIVLTVASRSDDFWHTLTTHPTANNIGTIGVLIILVSIAALRKMSNFKP